MKPLLASLAASAAALVVTVGCPGSAQADDSGVTAAMHLANGWRYLGPVGESMLLGGGASVGFYLGGVRAGAQGQLLGSTSYRGAGLDLGGYLVLDIVKVALERRVSIGAPFFRLDGLVRTVLPTGEVGGTTMLSVGIRALGISIGVGAGPELGLAPNANKLGISSQVRIEFDFVEGLYALPKLKSD